MDNIKKIGYLCLVIVIGLEIGSVIANLKEGYSPFYLFDLGYKFGLYSMFGIYNNLFIPYWGSLIGIIFFIREFESFGKFFELGKKKNQNPFRRIQLILVNGMLIQDRGYFFGQKIK